MRAQLKNRQCRFFNCGAFWTKSEPILGKIPTLIFSPPPAAAGRTKLDGSRAKNFLPLNPSIFCPLVKILSHTGVPEKILE